MAKPIFCTTHPRACSTAFERVFMTRNDLACVHEPFGDAFYYGPERLSTRFEGDPDTRTDSGFSSSTYKTIFDRIEREGDEGKRLFIKDITYYLMPPDGKAPKIAPSLLPKKRGIGTENGTADNVNGVQADQATKLPFPYDTDAEAENPTVVPQSMLEKFHFTFLIRDPHSSIPSWYRCTVPPIVEMTGFHDFYPNEAGYDELRRFFEYLCRTGQVGPDRAGSPDSQTNSAPNDEISGSVTNGNAAKTELCVIDADDLLDDPEGIMKAYCESVGLDFTPAMLNWDNDEDQEKAKKAFEKWKGFHEDAIDSKDLKPRNHRKTKSEEQWDSEWKEKYGAEAASVIRQTVNDNMDDYLYLKQYAIQV